MVARLYSIFQNLEYGTINCSEGRPWRRRYRQERGEMARAGIRTRDTTIFRPSVEDG
jgi:hypothetical protein